MDVGKILDHLMDSLPNEEGDEFHILILINKAIECFMSHKNTKLLSVKVRNDYIKYKIYRNNWKQLYFVILNKLEKAIQNNKINQYDIAKIEEWLVASHNNFISNCP